MNLQIQILSHKWKNCKVCKGFDTIMVITCEYCRGSCFELMEIGNPIEIITKRGIDFQKLKYKEGEIIEIDSPHKRRLKREKFKIIKTQIGTGWGVIPVGGK